MSSYGLTLEDGTETLSRNVRNKLPIYAVYNPRKSEDFLYISTEAWNFAYSLPCDIIYRNYELTGSPELSCLIWKFLEYLEQLF